MAHSIQKKSPLKKDGRTPKHFKPRKMENQKKKVSGKHVIGGRSSCQKIQRRGNHSELGKKKNGGESQAVNKKRPKGGKFPQEEKKGERWEMGRALTQKEKNGVRKLERRAKFNPGKQIGGIRGELDGASKRSIKK